MKTKKATWLALLASVLTFASGVLAWETKIHGSFADNSANAAVVDVEGNIIAAGYLAAVDGSSLFTVVKFSGIDGSELWRQSLTGVAGAAYSIALDRGFDVVAAGITFMPGNVRGFTVAKFSGIDGSESWRRIIIGSDPGPFPNFNVANSVSVDGAGNVVAAGYTTDRFFNWSYTVIKFSGTDGEELWRQLIHGTSDRPGQDQAFAVTVGPAGNGASAGWVDTASDTVSKFTVVSTAVKGWVQFVEGSDHTLGAWNTAFAVSLDALGNVVAAGSLQNIDTDLDFAVIGFAGADGRQLWRQVVNGSADERDEAYAVVGYGTGAVAAGYLKNLGTGRDFAVISFCGQCGENWRQVIDAGGNEVADAVAVDGNGDVLAGGTFTAIKFRGSDGAELWRQVVDHTFANAIAVDALGDVIAVGSNGDGDFTVIKLRGTDGGDF